eukprot:SAG11_NODE_1460_length_4870_cov_13.894571_3_plen_56_part_00
MMTEPPAFCCLIEQCFSRAAHSIEALVSERGADVAAWDEVTRALLELGALTHVRL